MYLDLRGTNLEKGLREGHPEYITTGIAAECCGVSKVTVLRWIKKGYLTAFRLPDGHYRINGDDFSKFLVKHSMPIRKPMFKTDMGDRV